MKNSILIEGINYISSSRAAEITKYSNDYIGQLCRAGKISAKRIGRLWFVDEAILLEYKKKSDENFKSQEELVAEGSTIQNDGMNSISAFDGIVDESRLSNLESNSSKQTEEILLNENEISSTNDWNISYASDDRPLLPELHKQVEDDYNHVAINVVDSIDTDSFSHESYIAPKSVRMSNLRTISVSILVVCTIFVLGLTVVNIISPSWKSTSSDSIALSSSQSSAGVFDAVGKFFGSIHRGFNNVLAVFTGRNQLTINTENNNINRSLDNGNESSGLVIVPREGDEGLNINVGTNAINGSDEAIKAEIRRSFSDEVVVKPDQNGTAGVITPVFREAKGKDFIYVMVPVKTDAEVNNSKKL